MRLLRAFLAVAIFSLAHCDSNAPPTPSDTAWTVNLVNGGGQCVLASSHVSFGDSSISADATNTSVKNQESVMGLTANVTCAVVPLPGGGFQVQATTTIGGNELQVSIAKIDASASMASPAAGTVTYTSSATVKPYSGTCNFYFAGASQSVATGKLFASFACPMIVDNSSASACAVSESYFAVENCSSAPIS